MDQLAGLGPRYLRVRRGRSALGLCSVAIGVALFFGVAAASTTINHELASIAHGLGGSADVRVQPLGAAASPLSSEDLGRLARTPGVRRVIPVVGTPAVLVPRASGAPGATMPTRFRRRIDVPSGVALFGMDRADAGGVLGLAAATGRLPSAADQIALSAEVAHSIGVRVGDRIRLYPGGRTATVTGVLVPGGLELANRQRFALTTDAGVHAMAPGARATNALVLLASHRGTARWIDAHQPEFPGVAFDDLSAARHPLQDAMDGFERALRAFGLLALVVAGFIVYLSLSAAVAERLGLYGTLRALGASRRQVAVVLLGEAAALGVAGTILGAVLGVGIASALSTALTSIFNVARPHLSVSGTSVLGAVVVGILVPVVAAAAPAIRAAGIGPVDAMRGQLSERHRRLPGAAGVALLTLGAAAAVSPGRSLRLVASVPALAGAVLVLPVLLAPLAERLRGLMARTAPGMGDVAVLHLVRERSRSAYTAGLVMLVLAATLLVGSGYASMRPSFARFAQRELGADVFLRATSDTQLAPALPRAAVDKLAHLPQISSSSPVWYGGASLGHAGGRTQSIEIIDPATYFSVADFAWVQGSAPVARAALDEGGAALLPTSLAEQLHVHRGSALTLVTNRGPRSFVVVATFASFEIPPRVVLGIGDGRAEFGAQDPALLVADLTPGASVSAVVAAAARSVGPGMGIGVEDGRTVKRQALARFNSVFVVFLVLLAILVVIGLIGLANTMVISVSHRHRELGILRAVGAHRREVAAMIVVETATLVAVALLVAVVLGTFLAATTTKAAVSGFGSGGSFRFPVIWLPVLAVVAGAVAVGAAVMPARRASRLDVVNAIRLE